MARSRPNDEDEDEDRPRRRDRDYDRDEVEDDERPRGSRAKTMSTLGLLSLLGGIMSLLLSFIPCIGVFSILGGLLGILLGGIGLRTAGASNQGKGLPIAGMIVNAASMAIAGAWIFFLAAAVREAAVEEAETADAIKVSASQLRRDYDTNVVKADETYKGKMIEVTGQVKLVSKERVGRITVEIGSRDDTIDCDFGSATKADLAGIDIGQTVTIRGKGKGVDALSKYVVLEKCKLVKETETGFVPPGEIVKVEATKLLDEYEKDEAAANKTYKGKVVEVTGEVSEVMDDKKKELVVLFRGKKPRYLECRLTPEASKAAGVIRVGQKLTLRGTCADLQDDDEYILLENATLVK